METEATTVPEAAAAVAIGTAVVVEAVGRGTAEEVAMGEGEPAGEVARAAAAGATPEKGSLAAPAVPQEAVETGT